MTVEDKIKKQRMADLRKADREAGSIFSITPLAYILFIAFSILVAIGLSL